MSTTKERKKVVLLDSHAIIHRAYHAMPQFSTASGIPTGGLFGVISMIFSIVKELKPDYIIACYDLPKPTYRHEAYKDYKSGRKKSDEELVEQIKRSRDIFKAFNIPMYDKEGFEADDVIGTIAEEVKDHADVIIASGDMDTMQLIDKKRVQVYTLKKGINDTILYDEKAVKERFGFGPLKLTDYKGLSGDPSDNIVGVPGIGAKTATTIITEFGTIEDLYKAIEKDEQKVLDKGIKPRILNLLKEHKEDALFSKMLATIVRDVPIEFTIPEQEWMDAIDIKVARELLVQYEFRSLQNRLNDVLGAEPAEEKIVREEDYDPDMLLKAKVALWVSDSNQTNPSLEDIFDITKTDALPDALKILEENIEKKDLGFIYNEVEVPLIPILNRMKETGVKVDVDFLNTLSEKHTKTLKKIESKIYKDAGSEFNINSPKQLGVVLYDNLGLKPKKGGKTAGGARSTKEEILLQMKDDHEIIEHILEYRELQKLLSTYIDVIPKMVADDGRLHPTFHQYGAATGRMSSHDPNIQNIPVKTEIGREIREAFIAEKGYKLVAIDYSQIELRIAAFLAGDEKLIAIFKNGEDVHSSVASHMFSVPQDEVTKEMRRRAKVINFGILYGMGVSALQKNLEVDRKEAQEFYNNYFATFTDLADYLERVKADASRKGYTETLFGRRRYFAGFQSHLPFIRAQAERMAINAPIQGTQADVIKIAMRKIDEKLESVEKQEKARVIMQIHDELMYEVRDEFVTEFVDLAKEIMEGVLTPEQTAGVPIIANASIGPDWGHLE